VISGFIPHPKEAVLRIFIALKIHRLGLTTTTPRRLTEMVLETSVLYVHLMRPMYRENYTVYFGFAGFFCVSHRVWA
jgi:hypothetical protein